MLCKNKDRLRADYLHVFRIYHSYQYERYTDYYSVLIDANHSNLIVLQLFTGMTTTAGDTRLYDLPISTRRTDFNVQIRAHNVHSLCSKTRLL